MKKAIYISILLIAASCATGSKAVETTVSGPTQADVDRVQTKFPGYTLVELNEGKKLYENNCNLCHGLKKLTSETEEGWRKIVPPMVKKANNKNGGILDAVAEEKILKYVITMSGN